MGKVCIDFYEPMDQAQNLSESQDSLRCDECGKICKNKNHFKNHKLHHKFLKYVIVSQSKENFLQMWHLFIVLELKDKPLRLPLKFKLSEWLENDNKD